MKQSQSLLILLAVLAFGCTKKAGPTIHYFKKDGQHWYTSKIYGYPNGKRKLAQIDTYKKQSISQESTTYELQESILFYELWPNYEWKFVSINGFTKYKNGTYFLNKDSIKVPDNVIYKYFDKDLVQQIEVYKDNKRIKYTQDKIPKLIVGTEHIDRIFGQGNNSIDIIHLNGKYCADLGFGWYCLNFQKNGKYKEISGHSYSRNSTNGKWFVCKDTLLLISKATKKIESDTSYYIFRSDSLYSIFFNNKIKQYSRSKALIKQ